MGALPDTSHWSPLSHGKGRWIPTGDVEWGAARTRGPAWMSWGRSDLEGTGDVGWRNDPSSWSKESAKGGKGNHDGSQEGRSSSEEEETEEEEVEEEDKEGEAEEEEEDGLHWTPTYSHWTNWGRTADGLTQIPPSAIRKSQPPNGPQTAQDQVKPQSPSTPKHAPSYRSQPTSAGSLPKPLPHWSSQTPSPRAWITPFPPSLDASPSAKYGSPPVPSIQPYRLPPQGYFTPSSSHTPASLPSQFPAVATPFSGSPLRPLHDLDRTSSQFHKQLNDFFRGSVYRTVFPSLRNETLAWLVEYLDSVLLGISDHGDPAFLGVLHQLRKVCAAKQVLPKSCALPESLLGCLNEGTFDDPKVRIKRIGINPDGDLHKAKRIFHQVAVTSRHLAHPNIIPLLGVTVKPPQLVSDWMPGRDLLVYLTKNPDTDRLALLSGVADGLNYLHSCGVIHGNLNGSNILIDNTGRARITDFGLVLITHDLNSLWGTSAGHDQSARWIAPEILSGWGTYSKEADVFSFSGVAIEAFTGALPFYDKSPRIAVSAIMEGGRPPRPTHPGLTDGLWELIQRCWKEEIRLRPQALHISCAFGTPAWKRLIDCSLTPDKRISLVMVIFSDRYEIEAVERLRGDDAQSFVDAMDQMLDDLGSHLRKKSLGTLHKICGRQALLPRSLELPICYVRSEEALYSGGYADVWMGEHQGRRVAVKVLKVYSTSNLRKITSGFCKEVLTWKSLRHPNVLPLLGVTMRGRHFAMVSEWMDNGNINEFIKANWDANRPNLLEDVGKGLIYIHSQEMIHGDLKGANIMIDRNKKACLADFGLLTFVSDPTNTMTSGSVTGAGTTRWMSPELLYPEKFGYKKGKPTKQSDYYALGMVVLEVLGGEPPFMHDNDYVVIRKVTDGEHPEKPDMEWFTDDLWTILEQCWSPKPSDRPTVEIVLECLARISKTWQPLPPTATIPEPVFTTSIYSTWPPSNEPNGDYTIVPPPGPSLIPQSPRQQEAQAPHPKSPRRDFPSTIHGWLTKMRGTLLDNEGVRHRGIREMEEASAARAHKRKTEPSSLGRLGKSG